MLLTAAFVILVLLALGAAVTWLGVARLERAHRPAGRFIEVSGGRLHVVELAPVQQVDGPPVVLLHGASGNLEDQRFTLGAALAQRHRVILFDRPGHGFSERTGGSAAASPGQQAAMIDEALGHLGIERTIVVGHSWSGALASALAIDFPARVAGLVLLAPVTHPWPGGIFWYNALASAPVVGRLFVHAVALPLGLLLIRSAVANVFAPQAPPPDYIRRTATRLVLRPREFVANAQDLAVLKEFVAAQVPRYGAIRAPTLIISGDRDSVVSLDAHARAAAALIPGARLIVLEGVGHMLQHVAVDTVVAAVDELASRATDHREEGEGRPGKRARN
jgi:pimeloyl-ACP methyl ester carboxylesterase